LAPRAILGEDTAIRGRRARIPWACGHEAATEPQTSLPNLGLNHGSAALKSEGGIWRAGRSIFGDRLTAEPPGD